VYPVEWRLLLPSRAIDINVSAAFDEQELHTLESTGVVYREGSVRVTGTRGGKNVSGRGYLEMTGYSGQTLDRVLN
jgi:predicted secreted hydrolase